jgi:TPR repeat protein
LAPLNAPPGGAETYILFAAEPMNVAYDGKESDVNSPFSSAFAEAIVQPGSSLEAVYRQVYERVKAATAEELDGPQLPHQEGILFQWSFRPEIPLVQWAPPRPSLLETGKAPRDYDIASDGLSLLRDILKTRSIHDIARAAEGGDSQAQYLLGVALLVGESIAEDKTRAVYWFRRASVGGFTRAQFAFGASLYDGEGIPRNRAEAVEWWKMAADNKNAAAMAALGDAYRDGEGVPKDPEQAVQEYERAIDMGYVEGNTRLGHLYLAKASEAKKNGDLAGYARTSKQALDYFTHGAKQGAVRSQNQLGEMYRYGIHVNKDSDAALKWYHAAAEGGNISASVSAAEMLDRGEEGITQDSEQATIYWRRAAELGSDLGRVELADRIVQGTVLASSMHEALALYDQALTKGFPRAAARLASVYQKGVQQGKLIPQDHARAVQYALKALDLVEKAAPDSEEAYPMEAASAAGIILRIYENEPVPLSLVGVVEELRKKFGSPQKGYKRFTIPITCGDKKAPFYIYVWNWERDEPPTDMQFAWLSKARDCEVAQDVIDAFRKLYKIARENEVSYADLTVYAVGKAESEQTNKQDEQAQKKE